MQNTKSKPDRRIGNYGYFTASFSDFTPCSRLPELFTSVSAARKGNSDIAIGNSVGSNMFYILFICGISAIIIPIPFAQNFIFDMAIAIASAVLLTICCIIGKRQLRRWAGILMLVSYAVYFAVII